MPIWSRRVPRKRTCFSVRPQTFCNLVLHRKTTDLRYCFRLGAMLVRQTRHRQGKRKKSLSVMSHFSSFFVPFWQSFGSPATWLIHATGWSYCYQRSREQHVHWQTSLACQLRFKMQRLTNSFNRSTRSLSVWWGRLSGGLRSSRTQTWNRSTKTWNEHFPLRHKSLLQSAFQISSLSGSTVGKGAYFTGASCEAGN